MAEPVESRGGALGLLHTFANAVLAKTLPSVREWLKSKVGERASIEGMELDGTRVHLVDARLPLGPTAVLEVERATFQASAGDLAAGRPPLRMESMTGRLVVPDDEGGLRFEAPLTFEGRDAPTGREWVHGLVTVRGAHWTASMGRDEQAPIDGDIMVSVTSSAWALSKGEATAAGARIEIDADGRLDDEARAVESARLKTDNARVGHYLDALAALAGREIKINVPLPYTGKVDGELALEADGTIRADLELRTKSSSLSVHALGQRDAERLERATVQGVVSWRDLLPASMSGIVDFDESAPLTLEGEASGPYDALVGHASLSSPRVCTTLLTSTASLAVDVALQEPPRASARLEVEGSGAWTVELESDAERNLTGRLGGAVAAEAIDAFGVQLRGSPWALQGEVGGTLRAPTIDARLGAPTIEVAYDGRELEVEEVDVTATLEGLIARFRIGAGVGVVTTLRGRPTRLEVQHLDAAGAVALAALGGAGSVLRLASTDLEVALFALPDDAVIDVKAALGDGALRGSVSLGTPRSQLRMDPFVLSTSDFSLDGSEVRGKLAATDALDAGLFPGPIQVDRQGSAQLDAKIVGTGADTAFEGRLTSASLGWNLRARPDLPPVILSAAASGLRVDGEAVTLSGLEGNLFGGRAEMDLLITYVGETPTGRVHIEGADQGLGKWIGAAMYTERALPGLRGDCDLTSDDAGAMVGPLRFATDGSALNVAVQIARGGEVDGTIAEGSLSLSDLYELLPRTGPTLVGKGELSVRADLEGPFTEPSAALKIHAEKLTLLVAGSGFKGLRVSLDRLLARAHVSMDRVVWRELVVHAFDGKLDSQGLFGWGAGFAGLQAKIGLDDVAVGQIPQPGGGTLREHIGGRLNGNLTIKRKDDKLTGKGEAWIDEPRYPMLKLTADSLAKVGLKPPSTRGTEPLMVQIRGGSEGWLFKGMSGAVSGARCDGDLAIRPDGSVFGKLDLVVEATYLRSSTLLNLPAAALGDVKIPTTVTGSLASPDFEADVLGAFDHLVGKTRIGRGVQKAVDHVMDRFGATTRRLEEDTADASALDTDVLISRIARGAGDEEIYLDVLIDRGLSPDEIATRIEEAREG